MIRFRKHRHKKPLNDPLRAGQCDAVMNRANDNPYRPGTMAHLLYETGYHAALDAIGIEEPDEDGPLCRGFHRPKRTK